MNYAIFQELERYDIKF